MKVMKFGGSSLANIDFINHVADLVIQEKEKHLDIVVVVSAQGDTTDHLIKQATDITSVPSKREMDVLLSAGEQMSMALMGISLESKGHKVISLSGWQAGIQTSIRYSDARILKIQSDRILKELKQKKIVIVAGFQGINVENDITTLGRGGSDTTAVALAVELKADLCEIYTDVEGVYTADPRLVSDARLISNISYDAMLELANAGAQVMHNRAVYIAQKYKVPLVIRSTFSKHPGTLCGEVNKMETMSVTGVALDKNVAIININGVKNDQAEIIILNKLANNGINIETTIRDGKKKGISLLIKKTDLNLTLNTLKELAFGIKANEIEFSDKLAKVSVVGNGIYGSPKITLKICDTLKEQNITSNMILSANSRISVLVDINKGEKLMTAFHDKFELNKIPTNSASNDAIEFVK